MIQFDQIQISLQANRMAETLSVFEAKHFEVLVGHFIKVYHEYIT